MTAAFWGISLTRCLKDVLNKMLTFEAEMEPKIDAKRNKKRMKFEVKEKKAEMLQIRCQKGSKKLPKIQKNRYQKHIKKGICFFNQKGRPLRFEAEKVCKTHRTFVNS